MNTGIREKTYPIRVVKLSGGLVRDQWFLESNGIGIELTENLIHSISMRRGVHLRMDDLDKKQTNSDYPELATMCLVGQAKNAASTIATKGWLVWLLSKMEKWSVKK